MNFTVFRIAEDYPANGRPSYGLQPVYYYLSREQSTLGNEVHVIATKNGESEGIENYGSVTVHRVGKPFNLTALKKLKELLKLSERPVIHTHSTSGIVFGPLNRVHSFPLVCHVHGSTISEHMPIKLTLEGTHLDYSIPKVWYYYTRERLLWSSADRVVTVSEAVRSDLNSRYGIPLGKITSVYNGVDTEVFRPVSRQVKDQRLASFEGGKVVLYVGHFGPRKGLPFLIKAMKKISSQVPDAILVCIGGIPSWLGRPGYYSYLQELVERNDLLGKVYLLDRVPNENLVPYYSLASVLVLPSYYEAFAKVVIEAMACAKPVIASRGGGLSEIFSDGECGILVNYGSIREIEDATLLLLQSPDLAKIMGEKGRKRVERDFTWRSVALRINEVYASVYRTRFHK